jgi:hypothetical protein
LAFVMSEKFPKRRSGACALAELATRALNPIVAKQGFAEAGLLTHWEAVVGARIAAVCQPMRMQWPARGKKAEAARPQEPATLHLRVEPGFGLDVQHLSGAIIERVNAHLGWRGVARLSLRQEPLQRAQKAPPPRPPRDAAARARAEKATEDFTNEKLRAALATLGERSMAQSRAGRGD